MKHSRVCDAYFSATGTTQKVANTIAKEVALCFGLPVSTYDFSRSKSRKEPLSFEAEDIVIFGTPVFAGRVPNLLVEYIKSTQAKKGAIAIPIVLYGNRAYENALIELRDLLEQSGFLTIAAGAFVGQHSFSDKIAAGRPDGNDLAEAKEFGKAIAKKIYDLSKEPEKEHQPIEVKGEPFPYGGYFKPSNPANKAKIDIRKVKPLTKDTCDFCGICIDYCSMGAINPSNPKEVPGTCIKCGACVYRCPKNAKYFADEGYLIHLKDLESRLSSHCNNEIFI